MIENFETEFLAFAKQKPEDEVYDPGYPTQCALGQFVAGRGYRSRNLDYVDGNTGRSSGWYPRIVYDEVLRPDYTWGSLVQRLEAVL